MGTQDELDWFYGGGAGRFFPELWARFVDAIPVDERDDLIAAYNKRLFSGVFAQEARFSRLWSDWENALATVETRGHFETPVDYARAFARLENHFFTNKCFFETDGQLMRDLWRMKDVRGTIVQGQFDMICPPVTAWALHRKWPGSTLRMVPVAGHALSEPGITSELVHVMNALRDSRGLSEAL
jgi:proline iminopeptidase